MSMSTTWLGIGPLALTSMTLNGIGFSGIYPTSLALKGILFPIIEGSALGILSTLAWAGSIGLWCGTIDYLAGIVIMQTGFFIIILACLMSFLLFITFYRRMSSRESRVQAG